VHSKNSENQLLALSCPSIHLHGTAQLPLDRKSWYFRIFPKLVKKIQVWSKYDKNNGYFTWRPKYIFYHISLICS